MAVVGRSDLHAVLEHLIGAANLNLTIFKDGDLVYY
jgi:hypothetical protein